MVAGDLACPGTASFGLTGAGISFTGTGFSGAGAGFSSAFAKGFSGTGAGFSSALTGGFSGSGEAGAEGAPQFSQNRIPGASAAPHFAQAGRASIFVPQDSQNFMPGVTGLLHFGHFAGSSVTNIHLRSLGLWFILIVIIFQDHYMRFVFRMREGKNGQVIFTPQLLQNFRPDLSGAPHCGQNLRSLPGG
jgi:hypothetical protein